MVKVRTIRNVQQSVGCYRIDVEDVKWTKRGEKPEGWHQRYIVDAWNNKKNRNLFSVAQDTANKYKIEVGDDSRKTTWTLLIQK